MGHANVHVTCMCFGLKRTRNKRKLNSVLSTRAVIVKRLNGRCCHAHGTFLGASKTTTGHGEASARRTTAMTGDCLTCVKYLMIIFNTFLGMAGCFLLCVALLVLLGTKALYEFLMVHSVLSITVFAVLAIGAMLFILGFLGCFGAIRENRCLLFFFFLLIFLLFVAELSAGVWGYVHRDQLTMESFQKDLQKKYKGHDPSDKFTTMWNEWMRRHKCCGVEGPKDFEKNVFIKDKNHKVPKSCCLLSKAGSSGGDEAFKKCLEEADEAYVQQQGCHEVAFAAYEAYIYLGLALAVLVLTFELFAMFVAVCLFRGLLKL
ncbi:tetraspanin-18B-like isoform X3 [Phyllopteryx taeniolatus]|uniref:tetraspanin-18B-like isoform X3 n=1 Tax=Phyllopteryx taeniolatus TaxID=161469 RepID=UPI002AD20636|nr:tetraspanin-18B-like isoform X3 [Phyllopteryx taeniolatus]